MTLFGAQPSLIAMAEPGAICFIATVMEPGRNWFNLLAKPSDRKSGRSEMGRCLMIILQAVSARIERPVLPVEVNLQVLRYHSRNVGLTLSRPCGTRACPCTLGLS